MTGDELRSLRDRFPEYLKDYKSPAWLDDVDDGPVIREDECDTRGIGQSWLETDCQMCDAGRRRALEVSGAPLSEWINSRMIVCPECGNKRCPKATHHDNACTGSNDPGQPGSNYKQTML
jgi:hypothetical protein